MGSWWGLLCIIGLMGIGGNVREEVGGSLGCFLLPSLTPTLVLKVAHWSKSRESGMESESLKYIKAAYLASKPDSGLRGNIYKCKSPTESFFPHLQSWYLIDYSISLSATLLDFSLAHSASGKHTCQPSEFWIAQDLVLSPIPCKETVEVHHQLVSKYIFSKLRTRVEFIEYTSTQINQYLVAHYYVMT